MGGRLFARRGRFKVRGNEGGGGVEMLLNPEKEREDTVAKTAVKGGEKGIRQGASVCGAGTGVPPQRSEERGGHRSLVQLLNLSDRIGDIRKEGVKVEESVAVW